MNRNLLIGLAVVAGLSAYVSMQSDDDMVVAAKQGRSGKQPEASPHNGTPNERGTGRPVGRNTSAASGKTDWASAALVAGVNQWQSRLASDSDGLQARLDEQAWRSMQPPPPPQPKVAAVEAPPPQPVAPPFPHQWIGRFNDEAPAAAETVAPGTSSVSQASAKPTQRAVVAGPSSTWVIKEGDVIEGQWRVDRIDNRTMNLTYLPLNLPQTVAMK